MEGQTVSGRTKGRGRNAAKVARERRSGSHHLALGTTLLGLSLLPCASAQAPGNLNTGSAGQAAPATPSANPSAPQAVPEASQTPNPASPTVPQVPPVVTNPLPALGTSVWSQAGTNVAAVRFDGVTFAQTDPTITQLTQKAGQPLDPEKVRADLVHLFNSGRYRDISLSAETGASGLTLIYAGVPRYYIGRVEIVGVTSERLTSLLEFATKLDPGRPYTETDIPTALDGVKESLAENGYYQPTLNVTTEKDDIGHQINVSVEVQIGPQARVGTVAVTGKDPGISVEQFRKKGDLNCSRLILLFEKGCEPKITRNTVSNALTGVRNFYIKENRLEGTITAQKEVYQPPRKQLDLNFAAEQGPVVKVVINGAKVSNARKKLLVPVYEEGAVDNDLLNEGAFNIRDFMQQQGYFDVQDSVKLLGEGTQNVTVQYDVVPGTKHKVISVMIKGNRYFDTETLEERLRVKKASLYVKNGTYSKQLVDADRDSIQSLYRASGFLNAKVTGTAQDIEKPGKHGKVIPEIAVTYTVDEGTQQKFGSVDVAGVDDTREQTIHDLITSEPGQPFSLITLSNDRDAILSWYISHGFDHSQVEVNPKVSADNKFITDVTLNVVEGQQVTVDHVLLSGVEHTKRSIVEKQLEVHAGDPLDQAALLQTQRNLYNLALFNEVNAAVQNPNGDALEKNVLVQLTEAKRWDVTYGFGFEAQLEQPGVIPGQTRGQTAAQNGQAGASPRVSLDVSRVNLFGSQKSLTLHTTYGLLETVAALSFNNPNLLGNPNLTATISGGYSNVQNITTFQAQTSQFDFRVTQQVKRADHFIYDFQYRRISVNANSLEISPNLIPQLSEPVRVGGPAVTYFHDTRDPSPLNATRGQYFSAQEFIADSIFGSQTNFNRLDLSHSSYYTFGNHEHPFTFARNLRVGFENVFGNAANGTTSAIGQNSTISCAPAVAALNATCNPIPLPERLYAGGSQSHRGFGINDAGPRDLTTGYPVGGSGVVVNQFELRLPPTTLPIVGNNVNFVLFHDMGNVFRYPSDMFSSIKNFRQPNESTCRNVAIPPGTPGTTGVPNPQGQQPNAVGNCNFNYYSHALGLGVRYNTPVGPIRLDLSYNLNPPVYPVFDDYTTSLPYVGQASHFQFFFSIGQAF
jgi:outer membrane protein insertion porin family